MGWLRRSKAYGFYARSVRSRVFGATVGVPDDLARRWRAELSDVDLEVDRRDEMYLFFLRPFQNRRALESYLETGRETLALVDRLLDELGLDPARLGRVLEFACGYGRNTRFLVTRFAPKRLWVSDVDHAAVDANARRFGTRPLYSAARPAEWECSQRFGLVLVASLFTHLPRESWTGWLIRLSETLEPGGHLVITTHGLDWLRGASGDDRKIARIEDGFRYRRVNETSGRLSCDEYGCSYVTPDWVRERARECGLEEASYLPNALWGQDVWALRRSGLAATAAGVSARSQTS